MTKTNTIGDYIETPAKKTNVNKVLWHEFDRLSTPKIFWFLAKRHKTGLLITWGVVMTLMWALPAWPEMLASIFG